MDKKHWIILNTAQFDAMMSVDELGGVEAIGDAFSFEALAARHNFERRVRQVAEEDSM